MDPEAVAQRPTCRSCCRWHLPPQTEVCSRGGLQATRQRRSLIGSDHISTVLGTRYFSFIENTSFRVTRRVQARVPRKHATYRRYRTARTDTGLRCGAWRGVATNDHTQRVSLYLPRPTAGLRHVCMCIQACSCADGQAASTRARLHRAVRTAQGGAGLHSRCHLRRCKRQGAAPRSWRPRSQEQKLWSARGEAGAAARRGRRCADDMASRLRLGRGRTGWKAGPREGPGRKGV